MVGNVLIRVKNIQFLTVLIILLYSPECLLRIDWMVYSTIYKDNQCTRAKQACYLNRSPECTM